MTESKNYPKKSKKHEELITELQKNLSRYFHINLHNEKALPIVESFIPDFKAQKNSLFANFSRMFSSEPGPERVLKFLQELNSCCQYLDLLDAVYRFSVENLKNGIPQGNLKKSLCDSLINVLNISINIQQNNPSSIPTAMILPNAGYVTLPPQHSDEVVLWPNKLAGLQKAMAEIQLKRGDMQRVVEMEKVLFSETELPMRIIDEITDYLKPSP